MSVPVSISPYAQKAVTNLISECHLMEFCDADAERIVQNAIDEAVQEAVKRNSERIGGAGGGIMNDTALNWIMGPDTGVSSKTIWAFMMGVSLNSFVADVPYDPSDFGRCYRLLTLNPQWKARLPEMAEALPRWRPLIDSWDQLEKLYLEEYLSGRAPKLYAAMQPLIDEGRRLDGWIEINKGHWKKFKVADNGGPS